MLDRKIGLIPKSWSVIPEVDLLASGSQLTLALLVPYIYGVKDVLNQ